MPVSPHLESPAAIDAGQGSVPGRLAGSRLLRDNEAARGLRPSAPAAFGQLAPYGAMATCRREHGLDENPMLVRDRGHAPGSADRARRNSCRSPEVAPNTIGTLTGTTNAFSW